MKALILAAGMGSRLSPITDTRPKALVPVNGMPIIFRQIDNLLKNQVTDISVVVGYKADVMKESLLGRFPGVKIIESADYASTNNMYSAYLAKHAMGGAPFLMMNADVFFDPGAIRALIDHPAPNAIVTDIGFYLEESMKVVEKGGRLTQISKAVPEAEALGASIDVYKFSAAAGAAFFQKCAEYIEERGEKKLWSEVALNDILSEVPFAACPLAGRWLEIDNHEDLRAAEKLFAE